MGLSNKILCILAAYCASKLLEVKVRVQKNCMTGCPQIPIYIIKGVFRCLALTLSRFAVPWAAKMQGAWFESSNQGPNQAASFTLFCLKVSLFD